MAKNYYEILEVQTNATIEEIKTSYKKLVKKYHPDISKIENGKYLPSLSVLKRLCDGLGKKLVVDFVDFEDVLED